MLEATSGQQRLQDPSAQGGSPAPPVRGLPAPDDLGLHERNRIVSLAEDIYITEGRRGKQTAHNVNMVVKLFREGGSVTGPGNAYYAKTLFLKLRKEYPEELAKALKH